MNRITVTLTTGILLSASVVALFAQSTGDAPLPSFDIISVKPNTSDQGGRSNFPLGPGDVYFTNGGHFIASNLPLATYLSFAYKLLGSELQSVGSQLPSWATSDKFDIEARTDGDPAKDAKTPMRLMMRSLLAERFGLKTHYETREIPVFGVSQLKAGKFGPQLQQHPANAECTAVITPDNRDAANAAAGNSVAGGYPAQCGGLLGMPSTHPGRIRAGARNVTMPFLVNLLAGMGALDRPVLDQTELTGTFDFVMEWVPDVSVAQRTIGPDFQPDPDGPTFDQALKEQLGLKLTSQKGPSQFLIVDHVEHPSGN